MNNFWKMFISGWAILFAFLINKNIHDNNQYQKLNREVEEYNNLLKNKDSKINPINKPQNNQKFQLFMVDRKTLEKIIVNTELNRMEKQFPNKDEFHF